MNGRILLSSFAIPALVALCACNGIDKLPGTGSSGGALTVQISQGPPATPTAGQTFGLVANVANDPKNGGVTWSCAPAGTRCKRASLTIPEKQCTPPMNSSLKSLRA